MLSPILVLGLEPGGQLTTTTDVENYPGFCSIQGPDLMAKMQQHAASVGCQLVADTITELSLERRPFRARADSGATFFAETLILATGARARWLGLPSEQKYRGFGVSACATCDGFFFRDQNVVVVGGGNTAVEEALFLTRFARQVVLVHRRDRLRAERILQDRLFANPKITPLWFHTVREILGQEEPAGVRGVRVQDVKTGAVQDIPCSGVFIAIGHVPATELVTGQLETHSGGYVVTQSGSTATSIAGVFAAGDIADPVYRQAITSAGMGCMAALDAERFLAGQEDPSLSAPRI